MRERMDKVHSKRFLVREVPTSLLAVIQPMESYVQPTETSAVELATTINEDSTVYNSSDESLEVGIHLSRIDTKGIECRSAS